MNSTSQAAPIGLVLLLLVALCSENATGGTQGPPESRPHIAEWPAKTTAERLFLLKRPYSYEDAAKWIDAANIDRDVKLARSRNDHRLIGIMGYTLVVPGVKNRDPQNVPPGYRVVPIEGTSDSLEGRGQDRFQEKLMDFAERYNSELLGPRIEAPRIE
jgi:hypothetical protein